MDFEPGADAEPLEAYLNKALAPGGIIADNFPGGAREEGASSAPQDIDSASASFSTAAGLSTIANAITSARASASAKALGDSRT